MKCFLARDGYFADYMYDMGFFLEVRFAYFSVSAFFFYMELNQLKLNILEQPSYM